MQKKKNLKKKKYNYKNKKEKTPGLIYVIIIAFTFILYGNTLNHDYVLDDAIVVSQNDFTLDGIRGIPDILSTELFTGFFGRQKNLVAGGRYRPLSLVTFAIEYDWFVGSPLKGLDEDKIRKRLNGNRKNKHITPTRTLKKDLFGTLTIFEDRHRKESQEALIDNSKAFNAQQKEIILKNLVRMRDSRETLLFVSHFVNVILYAFTGIVLFLILRRLFRNANYFKLGKNNWLLTIPFISTLLFIAHPVHTEVVANIKGRDEIMSLLLALITLKISLNYIDTKKVYHLILGFVIFFFALMSKENTVTFYAIIPLAIYFFTQAKAKDYLLVLSPMILATIIFFSIRQSILGSPSSAIAKEIMNNPFLYATSGEKYATILYTLLIYVKLLFVPHPLTFDYYPWHIPGFDFVENGKKLLNWTDWRVLLALIVHLALLVVAFVGLKKKWPAAFGIWYYAATLSIASNVLFPIGVFMNERFIYSSSIGFVIILAFLLIDRLPKISNNKITVYPIIAFFSIVLILFSVKTISRNPAWFNDLSLFTTDVKVSYRSAKSTTSAGGKLTEEAQKYIIRDNMPNAKKEEYKKKREELLLPAMDYLRTAIKVLPEYINSYLLLGNAHYEYDKNLDSTLYYYFRIMEINPGYDLAYKNTVQILNRYDDVDMKIEVLEKTLKYNDKVYEVNYSLGSLYGKEKNNIPKAMEYLEKSVKINPNKSEALKDLGVAYGFSGMFEKSIETLQKAIRLDPKDAQLYVNIGVNYQQLGNMEKAAEYFQKAGQIDPKFRTN